MNAHFSIQPKARNGFRVVCGDTYDSMSRSAAAHLFEQLYRKPESLFILATGNSPTGTYNAFVQEAERMPQLCGYARFMKLDEWGGLEMSDPATCETYLQQQLIQPLGIKASRYFGWNSRPEDIEAECQRVKCFLEQQGPADICVLGLGINGHLGFNEPGSAIRAEPHKAVLSPQSMTHTMLHSTQNRPSFGLTLGMRDILQSREIILLVNGAHKRTQLRRLLEQPEVTTQFPGSFLCLHPAVTIYCDREALGMEL